MKYFVTIHILLLISATSFGQTSKDTSKSKTNNSINVTGDKNHVVGGTGNFVGINGDVYVNAEKKLSDNYLKNIGDAVDFLVQKKNFDKNAIEVMTLQYCNYPDISQQIIDYLKKRGYTSEEGFGFRSPVVKGIFIDTMDFNRRILAVNKKLAPKRFKILVGRFK